jgi:N-formylglutamate amidohydrolase
VVADRRPGVYARHDPVGNFGIGVPLVVDSPHSGRNYPADFVHSLAHTTMRRAEDAWVDELFADAPGFGASFLVAEFPRAYVDPNRHEHDMDADLLDEPLPEHARPTYRSEWGLGVVRRLLGPREPIYDRHLTVDEIHRRIDGYHRPYHEVLSAMLDQAHSAHRCVYHLNCHSMLSKSRGRPRPDFVLSDREGESCAAAFTGFVRDRLQAMGYSVAINDPFKGGEIVARYGRPADRRHSLQIEIRRGLYMDERSIEKTDGFDALRSAMGELVSAVAGYARETAAAKT